MRSTSNRSKTLEKAHAFMVPATGRSEELSQQLGGTWVIQFHVLAVEQPEVCRDWCKCQKPESNLWPQGPCARGARQLEQVRIPAAGGVRIGAVYLQASSHGGHCLHSCL